MAQDAFKICIVYEDISRTQKLMKYINQVIEDLNWEKLIQIDECNLDEYDNCIIAISSTEAHCTDAPDVVMSRFSGSIAYRGNEALHDVILLLCKSQTGRTSVINGTNCIQIENSKPLQMATLTSARFLNKLSASCKDVVRLPCTVLIRHLTPQSITRAFSSIKEGKCTPQHYGTSQLEGVVLKPAFGGGSMNVILINVDSQQNLKCSDKLDMLVKERTTSETSSRPWLMQRLVGNVDLQVRVEVIDSKVCYAVVIRKTKEEDIVEPNELWRDADNLCMCEISDDIQLTICSTPAVLGATIHNIDSRIDKEKSVRLAESIFEYAQTLSHDIDAAVLAMEFLVDTSGYAYMIDLNLNSNYNFATEEAVQDSNTRFVSSAERYVEMFIFYALKNSTQQQFESFKTAMLASIVSETVPENVNVFEDMASVCINGKPMSPEILLKLIGKHNWKMIDRDWDHKNVHNVLTHKCKGGVLKISYSPVTRLIACVECFLYNFNYEEIDIEIDIQYRTTQ